MEQRITHACGHEQAHYLPGFPSQRERKARWLATTTCRGCFVSARRLEEAQEAARHGAAIEGLTLGDLVGSERQVGWAAEIRMRRVGGLATERGVAAMADQPCLAITDAKWWIDHRDVTDGELLAIAATAAVGHPMTT